MTNQLLNAARVIAFTPHIRAYLQAHDPKALEQLKAAIVAEVDREDTEGEALADQLADRDTSTTQPQAPGYYDRHGNMTPPAATSLLLRSLAVIEEGPDAEEHAELLAELRAATGGQTPAPGYTPLGRLDPRD